MEANADNLGREVQNRQGRPRLYHKKSKAGCTRCRARRVKCDETRPVCNNCHRHSVPCLYNGEPDASSSSRGVAGPGPPPIDSISRGSSSGQLEPASGFQIPSQPLTTACVASPLTPHLELLLMHNFTAHTARALAGAYIPAICELWVTRIPRLALSHPPLLHALLAFSAQHMLVVADTGVQGASSAELAAFRASCLNSALRNHRESLSSNGGGEEASRGAAASPTQHQAWNSSSRSADMVCFTSVLLMHDALAGLFDRRLDPYEPPLQWLRMARGVFFTGSAAMFVAMADPGSHFMTLVRAADDLKDVYDPNAAEVDEQDWTTRLVFPELVLAKTADGETWLETDMERADKETTDAYHHTVGQVAAMTRALEKGADWKALGRRLTTFAVMLRPKFIELLGDRRPKALVILAHYFAVATHAAQYWWIGNMPFREFEALEKVIPVEWQHLLKWPREVVERNRLAG